MTSDLTAEQINHMENIQLAFIRRCTTKYSDGQREHGGNLWDKSELFLVDAALDEAIDQVVYLTTLRDKLLKFHTITITKNIVVNKDGTLKVEFIQGVGPVVDEK